jgi:ATP-dependent Clp protease ATP-binding subunit ClpC
MSATAVLFDLLLLAAGLFLYHRWVKSKEKSSLAAPIQKGFEQELYRLSEDVVTYFQASAHPEDLLRHASFLKGVALLYPKTTELMRYAQGDNAILSCMALEAISQREDAAEVTGTLINDLNAYHPWPRYFALKVIRKTVAPEQPVVGSVLASLGDTWLVNPSYKFLWRFIRERVDNGEKLTFGDRLAGISAEQSGWLLALLSGLGIDPVQPLIDELQKRQQSWFDVKFLGTVGRVWGSMSAIAPVIPHADLLEKAETVRSLLRGDPPRPVLLVGDHGVGKTSLIRMLAARLQTENWYLFEAGHANLQAGQIYVGQLEERMLNLVKQLSSPRPLVWYIPDFHMLSWTGRSMNNPVSVMDMLLPHLEARELRVIGETTPEAYEKLAKSNPRCLTTLEVIRVKPLDSPTALRLGENWAEAHRAVDGAPAISSETLGEAWLLAEQYLGDKAAPGNLLELLQASYGRLTGLGGTLQRPMSLQDLLVTLTRFTGLPDELIGSRSELDIGTLRALFEQRVLGQPEAVDCLVERIAMIKAGVNDPTRPLGVFLFAGPTGSGKTEIAKTLTEFLFGSASRMIRLDMSEFQSPEGLSRIVGDPNDLRSGALVNQIREQPFSVVLLDEFEKSHPKVWDLFLQVFDDGRLTDACGSTADCRHAIFIMTSNLGSAIPTGLRVGFTREALAFNESQVTQLIDRTFSREFLNRLDRIVVFHPLSRETIRAILRKELREVFARRGLRNRDWAVVWEDSATEFLLEKGFTADMGARPLKRAVERHLLTPLAMTIVQHSFPEGDQFLIVRHQADGLEVEFVDPNIREEEPGRKPAAVPGGAETEAGRGLTSIMLEPAGTPGEVDCLARHFESIRAILEAESWTQNKQAALELMSQPGFWSSPERFSVLGDLEFLDRIEAGFDTAGSLLEKLTHSSAHRRTNMPRHLTERLAQQLYLLTCACESVRDNAPRDAFLKVEAVRESATLGHINRDFARRLGSMYRAWAGRRRMSFKLLRESEPQEDDAYQLLAAVSGFGAYRILLPEDGLHILEIPGDEKDFLRAKVQVRIAPQPHEPAGESLRCWIAQAEKAFAAAAKEVTAVARRYRERPSPLVRDGRRNWRTGRFDRVLAGDFDLFSGA